MRIDYYEHPEIMGPMRALSQAASAGSLEPELLELVKVRASQQNGCAHCLEMHTKEARAGGESDDRLHLVAVWRDAPMFTSRERAALLWCEELTSLAGRSVTDQTFSAVSEVFSEDEICQLTLAVITINCWNRLAVGLGASVGDYVAPARMTPSR